MYAHMYASNICTTCFARLQKLGCNAEKPWFHIKVNLCEYNACNEPMKIVIDNKNKHVTLVREKQA